MRYRKTPAVFDGMGWHLVPSVPAGQWMALVREMVGDMTPAEAAMVERMSRKNWLARNAADHILTHRADRTAGIHTTGR